MPSGAWAAPELRFLPLTYFWWPSPDSAPRHRHCCKQGHLIADIPVSQYVCTCGRAGLTVMLLAGPCQQACPPVNFITVLSSASPAQVPRLVLELPSFWKASLKGHTEYVYLSTCKVGLRPIFIFVFLVNVMLLLQMSASYESTKVPSKSSQSMLRTSE